MEKPKLRILDGSATTVGEFKELLKDIPDEYKFSLSGIAEYAIAVDDVDESILIDDAKWIDEYVYQIEEV